MLTMDVFVRRATAVDSSMPMISYRGVYLLIDCCMAFIFNESFYCPFKTNCFFCYVSYHHRLDVNQFDSIVRYYFDPKHPC